MTDKAIECRDLWKIYKMGDIDVEALKGVDLDIEKGEFVSIMGPSGSGKSTLMHLIGLLDNPTRGKITIDGTDTSKLTDRQKSAFRLKKTGFVFQFYSLLSGFKGYENVYLPMLLAGTEQKDAIQKAVQGLKEVGLGDRLKHKPNELSGGQRQRAAIARAIVNDPDIILADEPNSQLDTKTSKQIMGLFRKLSEKGHTVITVNHERELGEMTDRLIWLEDGKIKRN
ncbi:MAG: ABC transporter ATP-binding protein [Candidatus Nanohaloarchaea archaeon]|nr:ABC transporter ATP-binding protein [Candidatus Nanohaloarchaea archaeon]